MRIRYTLLAGASIMTAAVCGLGTSGVVAAQAATPHAKTVPAPVARSHDHTAATVWPLKIRPFYAGAIHLPGDGDVLNAYGCGSPTNVVEWPYSTGGCASGANEIWYVNLDTSHSPIYASYNGNTVCMNVDGYHYSSGTAIIAYPCNPNAATANEEFYTHEQGTSGRYWIQPWNGSTNLAFNIAGGLGKGNHVILYTLSDAVNEQFDFPG
jgi:hypothetical protein